MKHRTTLVIAALLAAGSLLATGCNKAKTTQLEDIGDTVSWVLGRNTAESLMTGSFGKIDKEVFVEAFIATVDSLPQPIDDSTYRTTLQTLMHLAQFKARQNSNSQQQSVDKRQEEYFAQLVAENPGVKRHPMGFYYEQLKAGKGRNAKYADLISFDYRSYTMFDGKAWDQSYGHGSISHVVGNPMFPGLIEAFQLMNEGSIYRFYFPYQCAFGTTGSDDIPGYTPFIYELELHSIAKF